MMAAVQPYMPFIVAGLISFCVEMAGGWLTRLDSWYEALEKPAWQPPGWAFAPAWTVMFILITISAGLSWQAAGPGGGKMLVVLFAINAAFNIGWSALFFRARRPDWALYENCAFWLSVLSLVLATSFYSSTASLLLLPYLAWVSFAAFLNWTVARLNGYL